jgi:hypothetical protein
MVVAENDPARASRERTSSAPPCFSALRASRAQTPSDGGRFLRSNANRTVCTPSMRPGGPVPPHVERDERETGFERDLRRPQRLRRVAGAHPEEPPQIDVSRTRIECVVGIDEGAQLA